MSVLQQSYVVPAATKAPPVQHTDSSRKIHTYLPYTALPAGQLLSFQHEYGRRLSHARVVYRYRWRLARCGSATRVYQSPSGLGSTQHSHEHLKTRLCSVGCCVVSPREVKVAVHTLPHTLGA